MYCPSCGNELPVELKYCNRCGANLSALVPTGTTSLAPVKLTGPSIVLGLTVVSGLGIIGALASQLAIVGVHPAAIVWMVLFAAATLFGCVALMIRFWTKLITVPREVVVAQPQVRMAFQERPVIQNLPPRIDPVPSVTENTTRTFSPVYSEPQDRGTK